MKENIPFLIARRRNNQKRGLDLFLTEFCAATGLALTPSAIVSPDASVGVERSLTSSLHESCKRTSELTWNDVVDRLLTCARVRAHDPVLVLLSHHFDFTFRTTFGSFVRYADAMVDFDGDTIIATTDDLQHGVCIDMYTSEITEDLSYTIDLWGHFRAEFEDATTEH